MRLRSGGHAALAVVFIALGVQGFATHVLTAVWAPVPKTTPARDVLVYVCAGISLAAGIGLLWRRTAGLASRVLFIYVLLWWLLFRIAGIVRAPSSFPAWDGAAETTAVLAGVWILYVWCAGAVGLRAARALYGLALIPFGLAHLVYPRETATLVPHWLPAHGFLVYFTASAFLAAAVSVLTGYWARWAAGLSALQVGLFTLLVWVPVLVRGSNDPSDWSEFAISAAITAAAWVVADSYWRGPSASLAGSR